MTCDEQKERISAFLDGELPENRASEMFEHLPGCPDCRAFLGLMMKVRKSVAAEELPWPEALDERILSGIERQKTPPVLVRSGWFPFWSRRISWSFGFAGAAIVLAFLLGGLLGSVLPPWRGQELPIPIQTRIAEEPRRPAAVLIIYSLPEIQSTGFIPAKYQQVQSDTMY